MVVIGEGHVACDAGERPGREVGTGAKVDARLFEVDEGQLLTMRLVIFLGGVCRFAFIMPVPMSVTGQAVGRFLAPHSNPRKGFIADP